MENKRHHSCISISNNVMTFIHFQVWHKSPKPEEILRWMPIFVHTWHWSFYYDCQNFQVSNSWGVATGSDEALLSGDSNGLQFDGVLNTIWDIITVQIQKPFIFSSVHWLQLMWLSVALTLSQCHIHV